jgi:hypothetical protein
MLRPDALISFTGVGYLRMSNRMKMTSFEIRMAQADRI